MMRGALLLAGVCGLLLGCRSTDPLPDLARIHGPIQLKAPPPGFVLVIVQGGPVKNKGEHLFPEGSSLAAVLDWAGVSQSFPPRRVEVVQPDGTAVRRAVAGRPRAELEAIPVTHGLRVFVPWDRCFGRSAPSVRGALEQERVGRDGVVEAGRRWFEVSGSGGTGWSRGAGTGERA